MKRRGTTTLLISLVMIFGTLFSDGTIVSHTVITCRGSSLQESELNQTGTLTLSSDFKLFCKWKVQQVQEPSEAIIFHAKELSFPNCMAKLTLPNATAVCVRKQPLCYAYISSNSYCLSADLQRQAEGAYHDCNTTDITRGLDTPSIVFDSSGRESNKFEIEFMKVTCEYQPTTEPASENEEDADTSSPGLIAALLVIPVGLFITAIAIFFLLPKKQHKDEKVAVGGEADAARLDVDAKI